MTYIPVIIPQDNSVPVNNAVCPSGLISYTESQGSGYETHCVTQSYIDQQTNVDLTGAFWFVAIFIILVIGFLVWMTRM